MKLQAISIGYAFPRTDFDSAVHSVFQSAVNLRTGEDKGLLTLVASSEADLPQGIRVNMPRAFSFEILEVGEPAICRDANLRIGSWTFNLRVANRYVCALSSMRTDMTQSCSVAAWKSAWRILTVSQAAQQAEIIAACLWQSDQAKQTVISRKVGEAMFQLLLGTRQFTPDVGSSLNQLIGLGPGLTPSGDDLLVGYLAGLWCTTRGIADRLSYISRLGEKIVSLSHNTNEISRTYLYHASQGQISSHLAALAETICRGDHGENVRIAVESATQVGHTSGMDAVTGMLIGMAAWDNESLLSISL